MKRKTKIRFGRFVGAVLAIALAIGAQTGQAYASESVDSFVLTETTARPDFDNPDMEWTTVGGNANARGVHLYDCYIGRNYSSAGLYMEFGTACSADAEKVGVSDIEVHKKIGIFWSRVASGDGGYRENDYSYGGSTLYPNTEYGQTYRVSCRHYAYVDGEYIYLDNVTDGWKYTY